MSSFEQIDDEPLTLDEILIYSYFKPVEWNFEKKIFEQMQNGSESCLDI